MKHISRNSEYGKNRHVLQFETPEDEALTNAQLLNVADGTDPNGRPSHFGGTVARYERDGKKFAEVVVYID